MTLLLVEPFGKYAAGATGYTDMGTDNASWVAVGTGPTVESSTGRFGENVLRFENSSTGSFLAIPFDVYTVDSTVILGFTYQGQLESDTSGGDDAPSRIVDASPSSSVGTSDFHFRLSADLAGNLYLFNTSVTAPPVAFAANVIRPGLWHYIELKVNMVNTGNAEVRVDGVTVMTATSLDFLDTTSGLSFIRFYGIDDFARYGHVIMQDSLGSAPFNDFIGDTRLEIVLPDADGGTTQWTASAGSNFQTIDDALGAYDDDTTYIEETTATEDNLASHATVSASGATSIKFVALSVLARDDGVSPDDIALLCKSGATTDVGATLALTTAYQWQNNFYPVDPNTSSAWTVSNINSAEFGARAIA